MKSTKHALAICLAFCLAGCVVPNAQPCHGYPVRSPCGVGLPSCVPPVFAEPQVPLYSPHGDLQLVPRSQFKVWDTTSPLE